MGTVGAVSAQSVDGSAAVSVAPAAKKKKRCTPGYSPCIRNKASDVDCWGGSGNGPRYTKPGVTYRVRGRDRYGLDADNDGWGCEPSWW
jgi:hypothetical protein